MKKLSATAEPALYRALVNIPAGGVELEGVLAIPGRAKGVVLFAHGSGSSRHSPRNNFVAEKLHDAGVSTLLMDLLTRQEDMIYENRFDIDRLTSRLERATLWLIEQPPVQSVAIGYFGASTGAAAVLSTAAHLGTGNRRGGVPRRPARSRDGGAPTSIGADPLYRWRAR